jgi:predicted ATPase/class 3 adenylate cyclase
VDQDDPAHRSAEILRLVGDKLDLDTYSVVGSYRRFSFETRSLMGVWWEAIHSALATASRQRQNLLLWGKPGEGKTRFVTETATALENKLDRFSFISFNCAKDSNEQFEALRQQLREGRSVPTLCFFDEIDDPSATALYGRMLELLELNERADRHVVFVLAASGYGSLESMAGELRSRDKGADAISRVPASNRVTVPEMDLGDRLLVFVSVAQAQKQGESTTAFEQFGLYNVLCRSELDTPREVTIVAQQAVGRMRSTETVLRYGHLFDASEEGRRFRFRRDHEEAAASLSGAISLHVSAAGVPEAKPERVTVATQSEHLGAGAPPIPSPGFVARALPSGTVTLLMTDIERSTRLWEESPEAMARSLRRHDEIMRTTIEESGGYVFKTVGDAFCAAFSSASDAVGAAGDAQRLLTAENWPEPIELRVRMALHSGTCEERDADYFGPAVNRTARLESIAHGGQVLVSRATAELIQDALSGQVSLRDLGEHRLKDLGRPEYVYQLDIEGLTVEFPAIRSLDSPELENNLPIQLSSFIGRQKELSEVAQLMATCRLVTLTGVGGSGKTRLALQVAAELLDGSGDGVWFVDLASLSDPGLVASTVAQAIGVREQSGRQVTETLIDAIGDRFLLIVLDNCEHLIDSCAKLTDALLRSCRRVHVLATSREPFAIDGEQVYRVPTLSLPDEDRATMDSEAVRLFAQRASEIRPDFTLDDHTSMAVVSICRRLDGMPLAIELAAARVASMDVNDIEARLDKRFALLKSTSRTVLPRQQTLRALIEWSYDLLTDHERATLRLLSVFAGGWDLAAAEAVCSYEDTDVFEVADFVRSLVDKSLVQTDTTAFGLRYRLLETVRQFAAEMLEELSDQELNARSAHAQFFLALAERAAPELRGPLQAEWLDRLEADHDNLRAAIERFLADPEPGSDALQIVVSLSLFFKSRHRQEGVASFSSALSHAGDERPTTLIAEALGVLGELVEGRERRQHIEDGLAIARSLDDHAAVAEQLIRLCMCALQEGALTEYADLAEDAVAFASGLGDPGLLGRALERRASALSLVDSRQAIPIFEDSLTLLRQVGDKGSEGVVLGNMAIYELHAGNLEAAERLYSQALSIQEELGDQFRISVDLQNMATVAVLQNDFARSKELCSRGLRIAHREGSRLGVAYGLLVAAVCLSKTGANLEGAATLFGVADSLFGQLDLTCEETEAKLREESLALLKKSMSEHAFGTAYKGGRSLALDAAVALALKASD